ncbi:hypothetical protein REPUB_Repub11eG0065800 [Reevesia pubescens]
MTKFWMSSSMSKEVMVIESLGSSASESNGDRKFGFVRFRNFADAKKAVEKFNGVKLTNKIPSYREILLKSLKDRLKDCLAELCGYSNSSVEHGNFEEHCFYLGNFVIWVFEGCHASCFILASVHASDSSSFDSVSEEVDDIRADD